MRQALVLLLFCFNAFLYTHQMPLSPSTTHTLKVYTLFPVSACMHVSAAFLHEQERVLPSNVTMCPSRPQSFHLYVPLARYLTFLSCF